MFRNFKDLNKEHQKVIFKVINYIESHDGWTVYRNGIENIFGDDVPRGISCCSQINIKRIRSRSDCIASHLPTLTCFLFDAKAPVTNGYKDVATDLVPLHMHLMNMDRCIYVMEGGTSDGHYEVGFETQYARDYFKAVLIPEQYWQGGRYETEKGRYVSRRDGTALDTVDEYIALANEAFPVTKNTGGLIATFARTEKGFSGNPFVKLLGDKIHQLPHWREVLKTRMDECVSRGEHILDRRQK